MSQHSLYQYFQEELTFLREEMQHFALRHPQVAKQLHINSIYHEDPQLSYLLEASALLNSRNRVQQDNQIEQLNHALIQALFPQYLAPMPSVAIIACEPSKQISTTKWIPRGTDFETLAHLGETAHFMSCYDTEIVPLTLQNIHLSTNKKVIQITLDPNHPNKPITQLHDNRLRFYIDTKHQSAELLFEAIMTNVQHIQFSHANERYHATSHIIPVGYDEQHALLPWLDYTAPISRLLIEYCLFKEKFLFFDMKIPSSVISNLSHQLTIHLILDKPLEPHLQHLDKHSLRLNCIPVINLTEKYIEPLMIDGQYYEYPLTVNKHGHGYEEIHTIIDVTDLDNGEKIPALYGQHGYPQASYAYMARRDKTHLLLSLAMAHPREKQLAIKAYCFDGDMPSKQYDLSNNRQLQLSTLKCALGNVYFVTQPKDVNRPRQNDTLALILFNHQLAFQDKQSITRKIKHTLEACHRHYQLDNPLLLTAIDDINYTQILTHANDSLLSPYIYAAKITVSLHPETFLAASSFLFSRILEKSFSQEITLNSKIVWAFSGMHHE